MKILPVITNKFQHKDTFKNNHEYDYSPYRYPVRIAPINNDIFVKNSNQPSFTSVIKSINDFKKLGSNNVFHCIYCNRPMLPLPKLDRLKNNGVFSGSILDFSKQILSYLDYLHPTEKEALKRIILMAFDFPNLRLSEAIKKLYPEANKELLKEQLPIFKELSSISNTMPHGYKTKFKELLKIYKYRLLEKEYIPHEFSGKEFSYKINRMSDTVKDEVLATRIRKLAETLAHPALKKSDTPLNEKLIEQIQILTQNNKLDKSKLCKKDLQLLLIKQIKKYGEILNRKDILNQCDIGINTLEGRPVKIKFSNKAFKYDMAELIQDMPDESLKAKIREIIQKLPTSTTSVNAFIAKHQNSASDAIGYDILRPSILTIEHMHPKSLGGPNDVENLALACNRDNNMRSSESMKEFIAPFPIENQQKYFLEIWQEARNGNIKRKTVSKMIDTFFSESGRKIDTSQFK